MPYLTRPYTIEILKIRKLRSHPHLHNTGIASGTETLFSPLQLDGDSLKRRDKQCSSVDRVLIRTHSAYQTFRMALGKTLNTSKVSPPRPHSHPTTTASLPVTELPSAKTFYDLSLRMLADGFIPSFPKKIQPRDYFSLRCIEPLRLSTHPGPEQRSILSDTLQKKSPLRYHRITFSNFIKHTFSR